MSGKRYTDDFKAEAVKQVLERGHGVVETAGRLGINKHSLYDWVRLAKLPKAGGAEPTQALDPEPAEVRRGSPRNATS
jgi:transposase